MQEIIEGLLGIVTLIVFGAISWFILKVLILDRLRFRKSLRSLELEGYLPVSANDESFLSVFKNLKPEIFYPHIHSMRAVVSPDKDVSHYIASGTLRVTPWGSRRAMLFTIFLEASTRRTETIEIHHLKNRFPKIPKNLAAIYDSYGMKEVTCDPKFQESFLVLTTGDPAATAIDSEIQRLLLTVAGSEWLGVLRLSPQGWCLAKDWVLTPAQVKAMQELVKKLTPLLRE